MILNERELGTVLLIFKLVPTETVCAFKVLQRHVKQESFVSV